MSCHCFGIKAFCLTNAPPCLWEFGGLTYFFFYLIVFISHLPLSISCMCTCVCVWGVCVCVCVCVCVLYLTLRDPMDCRLPGSSVHGIFQATILEQITISFYRGSSLPRDLVSCTGRQICYHSATCEAHT